MRAWGTRDFDPVRLGEAEFRAGCDLADPLLDRERDELVAAYTALLVAVRRR